MLPVDLRLAIKNITVQGISAPLTSREASALVDSLAACLPPDQAHTFRMRVDLFVNSEAARDDAYWEGHNDGLAEAETEDA